MYFRVFKSEEVPDEWVAWAPGAKVVAFAETPSAAISELMLELDGVHDLLKEHLAGNGISLRLHRTLDYLDRWKRVKP